MEKEEILEHLFLRLTVQIVGTVVRFLLNLLGIVRCFAEIASVNKKTEMILATLEDQEIFEGQTVLIHEVVMTNDFSLRFVRLVMIVVKCLLNPLQDVLYTAKLVWRNKKDMVLHR